MLHRKNIQTWSLCMCKYTTPTTPFMSDVFTLSSYLQCISYCSIIIEPISSYFKQLDCTWKWKNTLNMTCLKISIIVKYHKNDIMGVYITHMPLFSWYWLTLLSCNEILSVYPFSFDGIIIIIFNIKKWYFTLTRRDFLWTKAINQRSRQIVTTFKRYK